MTLVWSGRLKREVSGPSSATLSLWTPTLRPFVRVLGRIVVGCTCNASSSASEASASTSASASASASEATSISIVVLPFTVAVVVDVVVVAGAVAVAVAAVRPDAGRGGGEFVAVRDSFFVLATSAECDRDEKPFWPISMLSLLLEGGSPFVAAGNAIVAGALRRLRFGAGACDATSLETPLVVVSRPCLRGRGDEFDVRIASFSLRLSIGDDAEACTGAGSK